MQGLGDAGFVTPLAFTNTGAHRPAKQPQKIRRHAVVPYLHGAGPLGHAHELLWNAGDLANGVEEHLGRECLGSGVRKVLLIGQIFRDGRRQLVGTRGQ